jgi:hypothetical protein
MPRLNDEFRDVLSNKVKECKNENENISIPQIVELLNTPTQNGYKYNTVNAEEFLNIIGMNAYNELEKAYENDNDVAKYILGFFELPGYLNLEEETECRQALQNAVEQNILTQELYDAILEYAREPNMSGSSWAEDVGLGRVSNRVVQEVF